MKFKNLIKETLSYAMYIGAGIAIALIINNTVLVNAEVMSGSMESTINTSDHIIGFRLAYLFDEPERFDVVVFVDPDKESDDPYLKRIIGMPGEKVEIINGKVYINDNEEPLDDSFVNETPHGNYGPFYVPEGHYFMLGDNRNYSWDSKDWTNKFVSKDKILGKAVLDYKYFNYIRVVK